MEFLISMRFMVNRVPFLRSRRYQLMEGALPGRAQRLVREWAGQHQGELRRMWETQIFEQLPGLEYVKTEIGYPAVRSVRPLPAKRLEVRFSTGEVCDLSCGRASVQLGLNG